MPMISVHNIQSRFNLPNDAGTHQVKLPKSGMYTMLDILLEWTNGATSCKDQDLYGEIDRLEVIANGNKVLYSLTGDEARVWTHALLKRRPIYQRSENASAVQTAHIIIPFGLNMFDPELWLDASKYADLELRVTYSPTIAATSFATGTGYITVLGYRWEGGAPAAQRGTLKLSEQKYFTTVASGIEPTDLPPGNDFLAIGVYVYEGGVDPHANVDDVEVNVDYGQFIPVSGRFEDLNSIFTAMMGINTDEWGEVLKSDTDTIETFTGSCAMCMVQTQFTITTPGTTDFPAYLTESIAGGQVTMQLMDIDGAGAGAQAANTTDAVHRWFATAKYGLGNMLVIPFGLHNVNQALHSGDFSNVRLNLDQGNAGAECRISVLEVLRPEAR